MQTDKELFELIKETYPLNPSEDFVSATDVKLRHLARKINRKRNLKRFSLASCGIILSALAISWFFFFSGKEVVNHALSSFGEDQATSADNQQETLVYIYHTHNLESFVHETDAKSPDHAYDESKNITLVGNRLSQALKEKNINTIHNSKDIMGILKSKGLSFAKSYEVSRESLSHALDEHKSIKMVFDIHRDSQKRYVTTETIKGIDYARIVFVVSRLSADYMENLKFATLLHSKMEKKYPGLSRGVLLKSSGPQSTYNQDLLDGSVLLEIGGFENTLEEEFRSADALAEIIKEVIGNK